MLISTKVWGAVKVWGSNFCIEKTNDCYRAIKRLEKHMIDLHPFLMELRDHVKRVSDRGKEWIIRSPLRADISGDKRKEAHFVSASGQLIDTESSSKSNVGT